MFSRLRPSSGMKRLDGGQDRVVAAARAPAHLLVGGEVLLRQRHVPVPVLAHRFLSFPRLKLPVAFAIRNWSSSALDSSAAATKFSASLPASVVTGRRL